VFLADVSRMACQLMGTAFERSCNRITVVGYATDSSEILSGFTKNEIDIAVVGARLKNGPIAGLSATREIRKAHPTIGTVLLVESVERAMIVEAFRSGAVGVLSRDEPFEVLCKCIHAVNQGQVWATGRELRFLVEALAQTPSTCEVDTRALKRAKGRPLLTKREQGVVDLVAEGLTNRDISRQLNLSEHTVRNYLFRIFNKIGTSSRVELAIYALSRVPNDRPVGQTLDDA
jgi:DNA-binding NarL/FixJ family response regulator